MNRNEMLMHNLMNAANTAIVRVLSGILISVIDILVLISIRIISDVRVILVILANIISERFADSRQFLPVS